MRLICPNCGAQYEVDSSMIPDEGRDVQCSACGHTWYQLPDGAEAVAEPEIEAEPDIDDDIDETVEVEETVGIGETDPVEEAPEPVAATAPLPQKPSERLDQNILGILREEAQRETEARRAEQAEALEVQPELGLPDEAPAPRATARPEPRRIDDEDDADDFVAAPGSRGDLLPDIEEINSSLRPASEHAEAAEVADPMVVAARERRGFRWGFTLMIVLAALLVIAYVFAPQIGQQAPALEPALAGYVDAANGLRDGVEGLLNRTTESLSNMTEGEGEGE
jgi:predicted Zn finger-like uncharacterized protein